MFVFIFTALADVHSQHTHQHVHSRYIQEETNASPNELCFHVKQDFNRK